MKVLLIYGSLIVAGLTSATGTSAQVVVIDQSNAAPATTAGGPVLVSQGLGGSSKPIGQTFTPALPDISFITLLLRNGFMDTPPVHASISLYSGDYSGTSTFLATTNSVLIPTFSGEQSFQFDFSHFVPLFPGNTYSFNINQVENIDSASAVETGDTYAGGVLLNNKIRQTGSDLAFSEGLIAATTGTSAVPEPATWAMMILGMGTIGFAMRSAKRRSDEKFDAKIKRITEGAIA